MRIVVIGVVAGLLLIVDAYRCVTQRRQLSSGRSIVRFIPQRHDGIFVTDKVETEHSGISSTWEVLDVELSVMENVIPLSKTVSYPHKRVHI